MKTVQVDSDRKYKVLIGANWVEEQKKIEKRHQKVLYIIPENLRSVLNLSDLNLLYFTPDAEAQKDYEIVTSLWDYCGEIGLRRDDAIVAIGGGATTDLGGFIAATWLRGISWYSVPTSLAGAVDASIGGKTGINSKFGKNLIGSFFSPNRVIIDLEFFKTLPEREFNAGMAEVIKCGFISDPKILDLSLAAKENLKELIYRSVKIKSEVVSKDFKEGNLREILNYGHTLGHAIEKRENFTFRHGEAISIGLVFAAELSHLMCGLPTSEVERHRSLLSRFNLPTTYRREALENLLELMKADKKVRNSQLRFIGIRRPGKVRWLENVTSEEIKQAYERIAI